MLHIHRQITSLRRWRAAVVTQRRENADLFPLKGEKKRLSVLPRPRWKNLRRFWFKHVRREPLTITTGRALEILRETLRLEGEIVHVFFGHIAVQLLPFLQICPRPAVVSFHGADAGVDVEHPAWSRALRAVFQHSTLVLARSNALLEDLERLGCPAEKLRLQRTGVPLDAWPFRERALPEDGAWHFVQACRMVPKKGLPTTLGAFQTVAARHPRARLTFAGDGPLLPELKAAAERAGLADRVDFPGFLNQEELNALIYRAHVFLHPSETAADGNREGVPNALLEAMASGLPVLATNHGGIPEAVTHGSSGFLTAERDAPALARAALDLLETPDFYRRVAAAARAEVEEKFERRRQTEILEGYYDEALSRGRKA